MAISAKVTDQLVTETGTTVTVMELSPFTHIETTEATTEAGIACQPYGVVMAPADADGDVNITFNQAGEEPKAISVANIRAANKGINILAEPYAFSTTDNIFLNVDRNNTKEYLTVREEPLLWANVDGEAFPAMYLVYSYNSIPSSLDTYDDGHLVESIPLDETKVISATASGAGSYISTIDSPGYIDAPLYSNNNIDIFLITPGQAAALSLTFGGGQ